MVLGLAEVAHLAADVSVPAAGAHVAVSLAALLAAALMSLFGAYFAAKR